MISGSSLKSLVFEFYLIEDMLSFVLIGFLIVALVSILFNAWTLNYGLQAADGRDDGYGQRIVFGLLIYWKVTEITPQYGIRRICLGLAYYDCCICCQAALSMHPF